jgi:hypothetical protein
MPIRVNFGNWTKFVLACGRQPIRSSFSELAKKNSVKARTGARGGNNKGGKIKDKNGYVHLWMPDHPNCRTAGYIHEHRAVMSSMLGRPLAKGENVHHKNGVRDDNRPENLELWVSIQPSGQRVEDLVMFAKEILMRYGNIHQNPELIACK